MIRTGLILAACLACVACEGRADGPSMPGQPAAYVGDVVGNGHCVPFVQEVAGVPRTAEWSPGAVVRGNHDLPPGTPIATFEADGTYASRTGSHAAIYIGQDQNGLWVYDQWKGQPVHKRLIRFKGGLGAKSGSKSNDGTRYRVIEFRGA
ncbi:BPSL0067 family protein [Geminicoccus roseus]|uniref:BPSL0067 family protein n=1 Tax=Geminicoccus roseus TaxID=404900 RepID=UPI000419C106|nr:BPSL0067 family protein [Geminicoccus roseus]